MRPGIVNSMTHMGEDEKSGPYINRLTRGKCFVAQRKEPSGTHLPRFFRQVLPWTWGMPNADRTPPFYDNDLSLCIAVSHWTRESNRASNLPCTFLPNPVVSDARSANEEVANGKRNKQQELGALVPSIRLPRLAEDENVLDPQSLIPCVEVN